MQVTAVQYRNLQRIRIGVAGFFLILTACTKNSSQIFKQPELPNKVIELSSGNASAKTARTSGIPIRLQIPSIHLDAAIEQVGLTASGAMDVPKKWEDTGWLDLGPRPGEVGNAVIAGHLDSTTGTAVFWNLKKLKLGAKVQVVDDKEKIYTFVVTRTEKYQQESAPMATIFGSSSVSHLNLITCGGQWDAKAGHYKERLAVFTDAVSP